MKYLMFRQISNFNIINLKKDIRNKKTLILSQPTVKNTSQFFIVTINMS